MYKVFIIEDDPMVLSINKRFVEKFPGFKVIEVSNKDMVTKIIDAEPDLVLLDVFMPEKNGLDILREIRTSQTNSEVIMITAAQDVETVTEALRLGALDYIIKPYSFERLKIALETFVSKMNTVKHSSKFTQNDIDEMKFSAKTAKDKKLNNNNGELPKGLAEITLCKIKKSIFQSSEPISSSDMAENLSLSRITTRKYLEYLVHIGVAEVQLKYGKTGRPTRLYCNNNNR